MAEPVVTTTIPWYKSEINWTAILATLYFVQALVSEVLDRALVSGHVASWVEYGFVTLAGIFIFVQRTFFTTKVIEQSANRAGGS